MIDHLIQDNWLLIFPIVAVLVAALVFVAVARSHDLKPARVSAESDRLPSPPE